MLIYKKYTREALDRQYNNRLQTPGYATHLERWELLSRQTEKEHKCVKDIAYGNQPRELLDVYPASHPGSKTLVFIHGGYWQRFDKSSFQFIAGAFHSYDITTILLNYPLAPAASISQIVLSCHKAIHWLRSNLSSFNGNSNELFIAGHSAGAHLVAMLMTRDQEQPATKFNVDTFKAACAISGLFNLLPIQLSEINQVLQMDAEAASSNSPAQMKPFAKCPLVLGVGDDETEEFKDQGKELYSSWKENIPIQFSQLPGLNHFSILEAFCDPASVLHKGFIQLMKV